MPRSHPRPPSLRPAAVALVALGGAVGTAAREGLVLAIPAAGGIPSTILAINVVGALLLGMLLQALVGVEERRALPARLLLGTGVLGGFTTYSALATDTALLLGSPSPWLGIGYGVATVVLGGAATWLGIVLGARLGRPGAGRSEP